MIVFVVFIIIFLVHLCFNKGFLLCWCCYCVVPINRIFFLSQIDHFQNKILGLSLKRFWIQPLDFNGHRLMRTFEDKFFEVYTASDCILTHDTIFYHLRRSVKIHKNLIKRYLAVLNVTQYFICVNVELVYEIGVEITYPISFVVVNQKGVLHKLKVCCKLYHDLFLALKWWTPNYFYLLNLDNSLF